MLTWRWARNLFLVGSVVGIFVITGVNEKKALVEQKEQGEVKEVRSDANEVNGTYKKDWRGIRPLQSEKLWVFYNDSKHPETDHPYTIRYKGEQVETWHTKRYFFDKKNVPLDQRICFVHVGKTAGSTMGCMIGFKTPTCHKSVTIPAGKIPIQTTNIFHNGCNDCYDDMAYYLMAVRNPLHRIQSWFVYEQMRDNQNHNKYRKPLFRECPYKTLNDMAEMGLAPNGTASNTCKDRAHFAIRGIKRYARHNFFNYAFYRHHIPPDARILVVRTEHLEKDWTSAESTLNSKAHPKPEYFKAQNKSPKSSTDRYLSPMAQTLLCEGLCYDIQAYKKILDEALNLSKEDVKESLRELEESCPIEAKLSKCPTKNSH